MSPAPLVLGLGYLIFERRIDFDNLPGHRRIDVGDILDGFNAAESLATDNFVAYTVVDVDKDDVAVDVARNNLLRNRIDPRRFSVYTGNLLEQAQNSYDFIAANILTHVIVGLLDNVKSVIKSGGTFVGSGILEENQDIVVAKMKDVGFEILEVVVKEQWTAVAGRFKK